MDSSDLQNLLDLDHPMEKRPISSLESWKSHLLIGKERWESSSRNDDGHIWQCSAFRFTRLVDVTEHTLDGKAFLSMTSRLTFDF